jgi:hypothetical protein
MSKEGFTLPTQEDVHHYVEYTLNVLPFPIWALSLVLISSMDSCRISPSFIYFLMSIYHLLKLYSEISSPIYSSDPAYLRIWLSSELHLIILIFAVSVSNLRSFLFFIDVLIIEGENMILVIRDQLSFRFSDIRDSIIKGCDIILDCKFFKRVRAVIEILLIPYFFFHALFTLKSEELSGFIFYTIGYAAYHLIASEHHQWVWSSIGGFFDNIAEKNKEAFGSIIKNALDFFRTIPGYVRVIYPIQSHLKKE